MGNCNSPFQRRYLRLPHRSNHAASPSHQNEHAGHTDRESGQERSWQNSLLKNAQEVPSQAPGAARIHGCHSTRLQKEGAAGFYRGFTPSIIKNTLNAGTYFASLHFFVNKF